MPLDDTLELRILRSDFQGGRTIGDFFLDGGRFCYTLEDGVRATGVKVQDKTAIPAGRYRVRRTWSNRFKRYLPELMDVPMFTAVRIHGGNTELDTKGCILVGRNRTEQTINTCATVLEHICARVLEAEKLGEVWITIE